MMRALDAIPVEMRLAASPAIGKNLAAFRRAFSAGTTTHRRDLPWRQTRDPYRIWLSEIMLQQTRVAAVLEHYRIFLERFPNVEALAAASEDAVLAAWSGLGYYRRARMLHHCARADRQSNTAAAFRGTPKPCSLCPASDAIPPLPSPASHLPSPSPWSMAMSSVCCKD